MFVKFNEFEELSSFASSASFAVNYTRDKLGRITQKVETIQGVTTTRNSGDTILNYLILCGKFAILGL